MIDVPVGSTVYSKTRPMDASGGGLVPAGGHVIWVEDDNVITAQAWRGGVRYTTIPLDDVDWSCHTGLVNTYAIRDLVKKMYEDRRSHFQALEVLEPLLTRLSPSRKVHR